MSRGKEAGGGFLSFSYSIGENSHCLFWTFAFPDVPALPEFRESWRQLLIAFGRKDSSLLGVQVYGPAFEQVHGAGVSEQVA